MCITRFVPCLWFFYLCMFAMAGLPGCKPPDSPPAPVSGETHTLVVYCTTPCRACEMLKAELSMVQNPTFKVVYVNDRDTASQAGVVAFPTMVLYADKPNGDFRKLATYVGFMSLPELLAWIEREGR